MSSGVKAGLHRAAV